MFDFSHLPQNAVISEYVFNMRGPDTRHPFVWNKPPNCKLVFMIAIGGGGGGSGSFPGVSDSSRNGGAGGGSGSISQALYLAASLPTTLYLSSFAPSGANGSGVGGASGQPGESGSSVAISNYVSQLVSGATPLITFLVAAGGGGGSPTVAGIAGAATVLSTGAVLSNISIYAISIAGRAGTWVATGLPSTTSIGTASPILGGGGGGGVLTGTPTVFNGAGFTSEIPFILPSIDGGLASSGLDAPSGVRLPFVIVGGSGGGAVNTGTGGRGGNAGGYGGGGGGGGAGTTGGRGGDGGPAYACIIAW